MIDDELMMTDDIGYPTITKLHRNYYVISPRFLVQGFKFSTTSTIARGPTGSTCTSCTYRYYRTSAVINQYWSRTT
jgi:hypothetical protein